ncbi:MAG TPA: hypothetical protein VMP68_09075 [Candidatus Eisenbacteria bacterium]|nr:hypothetical protein [Candidatus Eisenbacteria bacterium]
MSEDRHPGISMHKLPVGGGFVGILFAIGSAAIFILGFQTLWYFVAFSAGLGIAIAALIRIFHESRSNRNKPLSILAVEKTQEKKNKVTARDNGNLFHVIVGSTAA